MQNVAPEHDAGTKRGHRLVAHSTFPAEDLPDSATSPTDPGTLLAPSAAYERRRDDTGRESETVIMGRWPAPQDENRLPSWIP